MDLVPFSQVDPSAMRWLREGNEPATFRLLAGDAPVLAVVWSRPRGSNASAQTSGGRWELRRVGHLNPQLTLRADGASADAALLRRHAEPGPHLLPSVPYRIDFAGGVSYRLHRAGIEPPAWKVSTSGGVELVHIEPVGEGRRLGGAAVVVSPEGAASPQLAPLLALSWYAIVLVWFEDEVLEPLEQALIDLKLP